MSFKANKDGSVHLTLNRGQYLLLRLMVSEMAEHGTNADMRMGARDLVLPLLPKTPEIEF